MQSWQSWAPNFTPIKQVETFQWDAALLPREQGPVFLFIFCPWARLSWAEISWAEHKFTDFVFFVFVWAELTVSKLTKLQVIVSKLGRCLTSPWAGLSKAELCNNVPYLDARTDRISSHTSLALPASLPHPPASPKRSDCKDFYEQQKLAVPWPIFHGYANRFVT